MPAETQLSEIHRVYREQIDATERRFRSLVRYSSDLMVIIDDSGNYLYVTDPYKQVMGYASGYFIGRNALDYIHPEDRPVILAAIKNLCPGDYIELPLYRFTTKEGEWRWIESKMFNGSHDPAVRGLVVNSRDVTEKRRLELERLHEAEKRQKLITRAIVEAQEKERKAIGNELHDNVNQLLTTVKLYLVMARDSADSREELLPRAIDYIQNAIDEIRQLTNRLTVPHQGELNLDQSTRDLVESVALTGALNITYHSESFDASKLSREVQLAMYRIVQEQLTNIIRHARASSARVELLQHAQGITVVISDDGRGFDTSSKKKGSGISNMRNRAHTAGGTFSIVSSAGHGCTVRADFPLADQPAD